VSQQALATELKGLRKGRGLLTPNIDEMVGPQLRVLCAITRRDDAGIIRDKLVGKLADVSRKLPADLRDAVTAALALSPEWQESLLQDRIRRLAEREKRDVRTIRRRIDDGIELLAQIAVKPPAASTGANAGWRVESLDSLLRMDMSTPTCFERRTIVAETNGLHHIRESITLPRASFFNGENKLDVDVQYGVLLAETIREQGNRFVFVLQLPQPLQAGDYFEYGLVLRVPAGQPMRPHYVFFPKHDCARFDLRIRFAPAEIPREVWRVQEVFHRDIDDPAATGQPVNFDRVGELRMRFTGLAAGHGYGAQWRPR
jgi:hypothetical protein